MTDTKKYIILYEVRNKLTQKISLYRSDDNTSHYTKLVERIDLFKVFIYSEYRDYDICYSSKLNCMDQTSFCCNRDYILINNNNEIYKYTCYFENIIIYFKEKNENIPYISNKPKVVTPEIINNLNYNINGI